ncbi:MAG TPA: hypothetical protein VIJ27_11565 [Mucilaginibacter sp.]
MDVSLLLMVMLMSKDSFITSETLLFGFAFPGFSTTDAFTGNSEGSINH